MLSVSQQSKINICQSEFHLPATTVTAAPVATYWKWNAETVIIGTRQTHREIQEEKWTLRGGKEVAPFSAWSSEQWMPRSPPAAAAAKRKKCLVRTTFEWDIKISVPRVQGFQISQNWWLDHRGHCKVLSVPAHSQGLTDTWMEGFGLTAAKAKLESGV